jgi:hypothetical protein
LHAERPGVGWRVWRAVADAVARGLDASRGRPWRTIEIGLGVLFVCGLVWVVPGAIIWVWLMTALQGAVALGPLLRVDGAATAWSLALALGRMGLAVLPSVLWIRSAPRYRWLWLVPIVGLLVIVSSPVSLAACASPDRWLLLAFLSGAAVALSRVRFLRWTAVLPFVVLWEVVPSHSFAPMRTADAAYRAQLLAECAGHPGTRPQNLTADQLMPYHGITSLDDDLLLLTGEGPNDGDMRGHSGGRRVGSWWLRRQNGRFQFDQPSGATGNLWRGCVLDGTIWMARANLLVGAKRLPEGGPMHEAVYRLPIPAEEMDFSQTACDPDRGRVYVSEAYNGGVWEVAPNGRDARRHAIGGGGLWPKRRFDSRLVVTDTARLMVFDPREDRVVDRVPAGLVSLSSDVCGVDGAVAVADMAGRLRVFELDGAGLYRFAWGVSLFAPRRVAYSHDCSRIAVTSGDDHRVFMVDSLAHRVIDVFRAGPALREVAATGPRELSVADSCSMTTYQW